MSRCGSSSKWKGLSRSVHGACIKGQLTLFLSLSLHSSSSISQSFLPPLSLSLSHTHTHAHTLNGTHKVFEAERSKTANTSDYNLVHLIDERPMKSHSKSEFFRNTIWHTFRRWILVSTSDQLLTQDSMIVSKSLACRIWHLFQQNQFISKRHIQHCMHTT